MKKKLALLITISLLISACSNKSQAPTVEQQSLWRQILDSARYAQNAHNMQSWAFHEQQANSLKGGLHPKRLLPQTDPMSRQLILSLGALTAAAKVSAAEQGYDLRAEWIGPNQVPENMQWPAELFHWQLLEGAKKTEPAQFDALSSATTKYDTKAINTDLMAIKQLLEKYSGEGIRFELISETSLVGELKATAKEAFRIEMTTARTIEESEINTRYGKAQRQAKPYGISLLPNFTKAKLWFIERLALWFPATELAYGQQAIKVFNPALERANFMIAMITDDNQPATWFTSGQQMQAVWAELIAQNLSLLPLSQGLQEYPEVAEQLASFQAKLTQHPQERVQMLWSVTGRKPGNYLQSPRIAVLDLLADSQ